jgi:hypothetical protein
MQHGTSGDSSIAFGFWGSLLGPVYHLYAEGCRFSKLACDVVDKHDFIANRAHNYLGFAVVAPWTQPIEIAYDCSCTGIRTMR